MLAKVASSFDYTAVPTADAEFAKNAALRIRKSFRASVVEIGKDLLEVKGRLEHGQFTKWLSLEFAWSPRSAERYMEAAQFAADKPDIVSAIRPTTLYLLSAPSSPPAAVAGIVGRIRAGETMPPKMVLSIIRDAKEEVDFRARQAGLAAEHLAQSRKSMRGTRRRKDSDIPPDVDLHVAVSFFTSGLGCWVTRLKEMPLPQDRTALIGDALQEAIGKLTELRHQIIGDADQPQRQAAE